MDINETVTLSRPYQFTGVLEVVDCIDYNNNRTIFRKTGLRNTFLSIFPDEIFRETDFQFYMNMSGTHLIMEVHNINALEKHMEDLADTRIFGIDWDGIYHTLRSRHRIT